MAGRIKIHAQVLNEIAQTFNGTISEHRDFYLMLHGRKPVATFEQVKEVDIGQGRLNILSELGFAAGYQVMGGVGVALTEDRLALLQEAEKSSDSLRIGVALGYPYDAALALSEYNKVPGARAGVHATQHLARAILADAKIPIWFAYMTHTPVHFNLSTGAIPAASRMQAESDMHFVRRTYPDLAMALEKHFIARVNRLASGKSAFHPSFRWEKGEMAIHVETLKKLRRRSFFGMRRSQMPVMVDTI